MHELVLSTPIAQRIHRDGATTGVETGDLTWAEMEAALVQMDTEMTMETEDK